MKLTVIVPIYNAEKYLSFTVDSLLAQGLTESEYEILLVDDGSTDDSYSICLKYSSAYPSIIHSLKKKNEGVSKARNYGIERAKGDYIYFIDADDFLMPGSFRYLFNECLEDDTDVLTFGCVTIPFPETANSYKDYVQEKNLTIDRSSNSVLFKGSGHILYRDAFEIFIWRSLFRRSFLSKHNLSFADIPMSEDALFNLHVYLKNPNVKIISNILYFYCKHSGSLTHRRDDTYMRQSVDSYLFFFEQIMKGYHEYKNMDSALSKNLRRMVCFKMRPFFSRVLSADYSKKEFIQIKQRLLLLQVLPFEKDDHVIFNIFKYLMFFPVMKCLYQKIFLPYCLPLIHKRMMHH